MNCPLPRTLPTLTALGVLAALAACAVGPDYVRPSVDTPAAYKELAGWTRAQPRDREIKGKWWEIFRDPVLNGLEEQVSVSNQNIAQAEAQYRAARALLGQARAAYFPTASGNASATRGRGSASGGVTPPVTTNYNLSLDTTWELDLWGRVRRNVEANGANAQASAADLENARLSMHAQLAQAYFQLRAADTQRQLLNDAVAEYKKAVQLTQNQYAAGVAAKADVVQAQAQLEATQAQAIDAGVQRAQLEHAIAVLTGRPPATFSLPDAPLTTVPPDIPVGVPSEILQRRPDVAAAERRVAAANAQIGVAESGFFPSLTLSAGGGYASTSASNWLTAPARFWSIGPAILETLFDAGLRSAQTDQAIAAYDATVATYRQTVLTAFQEVEDNLAALRLLDQEAEVQDAAVKDARESARLTTNQYKAGLVSYLNVVTVQTTALNNERTAVSLLSQRLTDSVQLIKALGGGWTGLAQS
jgi:NodT family efflux transporter outer membrane factor (OMF) lipoprotein